MWALVHRIYISLDYFNYHLLILDLDKYKLLRDHHTQSLETNRTSEQMLDGLDCL